MRGPDRRLAAPRVELPLEELLLEVLRDSERPAPTWRRFAR